MLEKCVNAHKSSLKNVIGWVNIHMKNVNDVDFGANIFVDMCVKV